jgi:Flp pilus assembly protein TadD
MSCDDQACRARALALTLALAALVAAPVDGEPNRESKQLETLVMSQGEFARAVAAHRRGDLGAAADTYRAAIVHDPGFVEAMTNLARVEVARGRLDAAAEWIDRAETLRSDYPGVHAARGLLALGRGDAALAVDALSEARELTPDDVEVLVNLGAALLERGFEREAIEVSQHAQRVDPGRAATSFNMGLAHDRMGEIEAAQYHYQRFLDQSPADDSARSPVEERLAELAASDARQSKSTHVDSRIGPVPIPERRRR